MSRRTNEQRVLLVEDDSSLCGLLKEELENKGFRVEATANARQGMDVMQSSTVDLLITDLRLPGENGVTLLDDAQRLTARPAVLVITGFGSISQAVECLKRGADDFLTKPLDMDHFLTVVDRLLEMRQLRTEVKRFQALIEKPAFHGLVGQSHCMREMFSQIQQIANAPGPVLVLGESGTGKELVARAIHQESDRAGGSFVPVNCAAIPKDLVESELFGHEAGAFTGATRRREGLFSQADGGTLFLDEIAEMPLPLQAKLLRVLQEGSIRPVGAHRERQLDVRVVAATNRPMPGLVEEGAFREDLYFRLETFTVHVPPLRMRGDDIAILAEYFIEHAALKLKQGYKQLRPEALKALRAYAFPGNVRELASAIERAVTFSARNEIGIGELPPRIQKQSQANSDWTHKEDVLAKCSGGAVLPTLQELQSRYIEYVLGKVDGNKRRAAALLGIGRRTLYRYLEEKPN